MVSLEEDHKVTDNTLLECYSVNNKYYSHISVVVESVEVDRMLRRKQNRQQKQDKLRENRLVAINQN